MKTLVPGLAAHLVGEVTTLCRCWRLIRRDGVVLGFTDHDRDIAFGGTGFEAADGLASGRMTHSAGLNVDSQDVAGALSSDRITVDDLRAERYDGATVEVWIVNWLAPDERVLDRVLTIGGIVEADGAFRAELRALAADMDETRGRRVTRRCDADLGDARCGVDLEASAYQAQGVVAEILSGLVLRVTGLDGFEHSWFRGGRLEFSTGANAGTKVEIAEHQDGEDGAILHLWKPPPQEVQVGDQFAIRAGCDKTFATCRTKFANAVNFRGFPHIPGNDFALGYASSFKTMDGGKLVP
ncbi:MAG: DUF2163 domain-containing protein [Pseudomonadota bacterium]|nr:DUF2163 domain-containing protein [Pseudomonadota bacterium]